MKFEQFELQAKIEQDHWWHLAKKKILRDLLHLCVPPDKNRIVIDVGCGTGGNIAFLADDYRCVGIDSAQDAIQFAKQNYPHVEYLCGGAPDDLKDLKGKADAYLLMDVLEHIQHDKEFLKGIISAAKPGAFFYITVPADMSLWSEHDVNLGHFRRYQTEREFQSLLEGLPVNVLMMSHYNARLYFLAKITRTMSRIGLGAWGEAGTDVAALPAAINGIFEKIFYGEVRRLRAMYLKQVNKPYRKGVSLIAVLQKQQVASAPFVDNQFSSHLNAPLLVAGQ